jgi:hypothetical protein
VHADAFADQMDDDFHRRFPWFVDQWGGRRASPRYCTGRGTAQGPARRPFRSNGGPVGGHHAPEGAGTLRVLGLPQSGGVETLCRLTAVCADGCRSPADLRFGRATPTYPWWREVAFTPGLDPLAPAQGASRRSR